ncbi:6564_t:CDS:2, partial [Acaulospora colombiana]
MSELTKKSLTTYAFYKHCGKASSSSKVPLSGGHYNASGKHFDFYLKFIQYSLFQVEYTLLKIHRYLISQGTLATRPATSPVHILDITVKASCRCRSSVTQHSRDSPRRSKSIHNGR